MTARKKTPEQIIAEVEKLNPKAIIVEGGMDGSIIGMCKKKNVLIYDFQKMLDVWITRDGMTRDEAIDWFYYNVDYIFQKGEGAPKLRNQKM